MSILEDVYDRLMTKKKVLLKQ